MVSRPGPLQRFFSFVDGSKTSLERLGLHVASEEGMGWFFCHGLLHECRQVGAGHRCVLRTDLMFAD